MIAEVIQHVPKLPLARYKICSASTRNYINHIEFVLCGNSFRPLTGSSNEIKTFNSGSEGFRRPINRKIVYPEQVRMTWFHEVVMPRGVQNVDPAPRVGGGGGGPAKG